MRNNSPWIHQLNKDRVTQNLTQDIETDIAIVGGGIAGISTAFFILRNTSKKVTLIEGNRIGHGATGHNAGQITSYFARPFHDIQKEFGVEITAQAHKNIENDAWELLDIIYTESKLDLPLSRFIGHLGIENKENLISLLEDNKLRKEAGLKLKEILVADHSVFLDEIRGKYDGLYKEVPHKEILKNLEVERTEFIACLSEQKGVMNSALFTEKVAEYLLENYKDRFSIFEHTHISKVALHDESAVLDAGKFVIKSEKVILCTNGFDNLTIFDKSGLGIDTRFHHSLNAVVGYMSGYLEEFDKPPTAISYLYSGLSGDESSGNPYIYLTRRPYEYEENKHNLISVGGPDSFLDDRTEYKRDLEYPEWARDEIDKFLKTFYVKEKGDHIDYLFTWHGLMGYTSNKLRLIGEEPKNHTLLYNLGCNGVGILPSIFGGDRISKIINKESLGPSIFDPRKS